MNEIRMIEYQQNVKIRKYNVDIQHLQTLLSEAKKQSKLTNKQIADVLKVPLTQIEHYFRKDRYFAIPDPLIWAPLKTILQIADNSLDEQIIEFIEQPGVYEKSNRFYFSNGIVPTILCGDEVKIIDVRKE